MEHEPKTLTRTEKPRPTSKAGVLAYVAKEYQAVEALADPDDAKAQAYLARLGQILDAAEAERATVSLE